jgi:thymidylate synthase (FAD)
LVHIIRETRAAVKELPVEVELLTITPDAERLIEAAGRTCYDTGERAGADSAAKFIRMLIRRGHLSVLEHASATFRIRGVSRALTHQLVRHRLASYSQRSQRYVGEAGFPYVTPPAVAADDAARRAFDEAIEHARAAYERLIEMGVPREDARFVLPNATATEIVMTANFREWRHVFALRGHPTAQWEIRRLAIAILKILKEEAPATFADFEINEAKETINVVNEKGGGNDA